MKKIVGKTAAFTAAMLVNGTVSAHAGEHGTSGLFASLMHLLAEHGYLVVLALCAVGVVILRRARKV